MDMKDCLKYQKLTKIFTPNLASFPSINESQILTFFGKCARQLLKGWKFKEEKYIKDNNYYSVSQDSKCCLIRSKCHPSMKPGYYKERAALCKTTGNILETFCTCAAGLSGSCQHLAALFFSIIELQKPSCTDLPCKWGIPGQKCAAPCPLKNILFQKMKLGDAKNGSPKKRAAQRLCHTSNDNNVNVYIQELQKEEPDLLWLRYWPVGIVKQQLNADPVFLNVSCAGVSDDPEIVCPEAIDYFSPQWEKFLNEKILAVKFLTSEEVASIEKSTRGQTSNPKWWQERSGQITASVFGQVLKCRVPNSLVHSIIYPSKSAVKPTDPRAYGQIHEDVAVNAFFKKNVIFRA